MRATELQFIYFFLDFHFSFQAFFRFLFCQNTVQLCFLVEMDTGKRTKHKNGKFNNSKQNSAISKYQKHGSAEKKSETHGTFLFTIINKIKTIYAVLNK